MGVVQALSSSGSIAGVRVLSGNYSRPLPQLVCHELVPGGKTIPVTDENK
jgi:hypothetical protein